MKRDGGIIILVLIISTLCMATIVFVLETVVIQSRLVQNRRDNIQADLLLESRVKEMVIADKEVLYLLTDHLDNAIFNSDPSKNSTWTIPIDPSGMDKTTGTLRFVECEEGRVKYSIEVSGDKNSVQGKKIATGHMYSPIIDHCRDGLVNLQDKALEFSDDLSDLLDHMKNDFDADKLPSDYYLAYNYPENDVSIGARASGGSNSKISYRIGEAVYDNFYNNNRIILYKEFDGSNPDTVSIYRRSGVSGKGVVKGIIYLEKGELIISGNLTIYGIIVVEDGRIIKDGEGDVNIYGKVIANNYQDIHESINIKYNSKEFRNFAKYLPGFISPTVDSIR